LSFAADHSRVVLLFSYAYKSRTRLKVRHKAWRLFTQKERFETLARSHREQNRGWTKLRGDWEEFCNVTPVVDIVGVGRGGAGQAVRIHRAQTDIELRAREPEARFFKGSGDNSAEEETEGRRPPASESGQMKAAADGAVQKEQNKARKRLRVGRNLESVGALPRFTPGFYLDLLVYDFFVCLSRT
jgi:hypothetical protein